MAPPLGKSNNRFSALDDSDNECSSGHPENAALKAAKDVEKEFKKYTKERAEAELPLREIPKSLKRSSQRVRKSLQQAAEERPLATLCSTCESIFNLARSEKWFG